MNYFLPILIVLYGIYYFWLFKNRSSVLKKSNSQLVERVLTTSDGSRDSSQKIKETFIEEGVSKDDIKNAMMAAYYRREGNKILVLPVAFLLLCLVIYIRAYLFPSVIGIVAMLIIAVIMMWLVFKFYDGKKK